MVRKLAASLLVLVLFASLGCTVTDSASIVVDGDSAETVRQSSTAETGLEQLALRLLTPYHSYPGGPDMMSHNCLWVSCPLQSHSHSQTTQR